MRFQCLDVRCGKEFGWTLKRIVAYPTNEKGETVTEETVRCPYCGSLDFDEIPFSHKPSKPEKKPPKSSTKNLPIANMEPTTEQFEPADLMEHKGWKNRKQGEGNYTKGNLGWGWDFKRNFKNETLRALAEHGGVMEIDQYRFTLNGGIVQTKKAKK